MNATQAQKDVIPSRHSHPNFTHICWSCSRAGFHLSQVRRADNASTESGQYGRLRAPRMQAHGSEQNLDCDGRAGEQSAYGQRHRYRCPFLRRVEHFLNLPIKDRSTATARGSCSMALTEDVQSPCQGRLLVLAAQMVNPQLKLIQQGVCSHDLPGVSLQRCRSRSTM